MILFPFFFTLATAWAADPLMGDLSLTHVSDSKHFEIYETSNVKIDPSAISRTEPEIDGAYEKLVRTFSDPKADRSGLNKIAVVLASTAEMGHLDNTPEGSRSGYFSAEVVRNTGRDVIFLDPENLDSGFTHRLVHEIQHLFLSSYCPEAPTWLNEGLSELLAWRVTNIDPLIATDRFLSETSPRSLIQNSAPRFSLADYGQSYLFARSVWESSGDEIFSTIARTRQCELSKFDSLFRNFVFSLLLPGTKVPGDSIGFSKTAFFKKVDMAKGGVLPPNSFAVVDVTQTMNAGKPLSVPSGLESYFIQYSTDDQVTITPIRASLTLSRPGHLQSTALLLLNLSAAEVPYLIK